MYLVTIDLFISTNCPWYKYFLSYNAFSNINNIMIILLQIISVMMIAALILKAISFLKTWGKVKSGEAMSSTKAPFTQARFAQQTLLGVTSKMEKHQAKLFIGLPYCLTCCSAQLGSSVVLKVLPSILMLQYSRAVSSHVPRSIVRYCYNNTQRKFLLVLQSIL